MTKDKKPAHPESMLIKCDVRGSYSLEYRDASACAHGTQPLVIRCTIHDPPARCKPVGHACRNARHHVGYSRWSAPRSFRKLACRCGESNLRPGLDLRPTVPSASIVHTAEIPPSANSGPGSGNGVICGTLALVLELTRWGRNLAPLPAAQPALRAAKAGGRRNSSNAFPRSGTSSGSQILRSR